ncbi:MAG TPA: branched-chain amino acid ABC transporter permease [Oscillospiraceae bacterium]|nr:branched-chain amino acid ABC transporter permease [Oscillospiraceae bacterium]HQQ88909.1 branched-chain amino acid ABC transporter permease [Oscillospiraceae bacterium]HRW56803.1 branched-chain amino acid ABC transporter permease [Oscillospiraceae bacterium]
MTFLTQILNGIQIGSIYALVALGYTMVYGIIKLINFAHGDIIMVGAYVTWYLIAKLYMSEWTAIIVAVVVCTVLGMVIEKVAYKPLRKSARISLLITAIGISFLLENVAQLIFTANPRMFTNLFPGNMNLGSLTISNNTAVTILVSVVLMVGLTLLVDKTKIGKAMRAVSEDNDTAQLMGINVNSTISFTFGLGSALAALAAVLYCCSYTQINPTMGSMLGLKAFVAAVLGGIGSLPGAMVGGFVIGIAESLTKGYIASSYADAIVFGILIVVLLIKPTGFFGRTMNEKV